MQSRDSGVGLCCEERIYLVVIFGDNVEDLAWHAMEWVADAIEGCEQRIAPCMQQATQHLGCCHFTDWPPARY